MNAASFNRFELLLSDDCVRDCSHAGAVDEDVAWWVTQVFRPLECTPAALAEELEECGAWDDEELDDDAANWRRIIWIAACNIREEKPKNNF